ncbi:MAG: hypothetical protein QOJ16_369 [Acidobacteriota bacterium]|nr:hypothetical protein [Acidobacteriota bacterium]
MATDGRHRIGLALGGGSARGWAHVGVLRGLAEMGITPDVIAGTSAGALVGAAYVCGKLDDFERWIGGLVWSDAASYLDFGLVGGLIKGKKLFKFFGNHIADQPIETLPMPFGAVATDLETGAEVWMKEGSLFEAVRASISVPGLLRPVLHEGRWCVDGGLVDPVPVAFCRSLGADLVIAVDVNSTSAKFKPIAAVRTIACPGAGTGSERSRYSDLGAAEAVEAEGLRGQILSSPLDRGCPTHRQALTRGGFGSHQLFFRQSEFAKDTAADLRGGPRADAEKVRASPRETGPLYRG